MPVPPSNHACWSRAAHGSLSRIQTSNLGLQLLAKRTAQSTDSPADKAVEIHRFFEKYERILGPEIEQIQRM